MIRFLHTADWQIGKPFERFGEMGAVLRAARLDAIDTLAATARAQGVRHVLVAGDVWDGERLAPLTRRQPLERMRAAADVTWWLLPGNHDPHRPGGLWESLIADGLPSNVRTLLEPEPVQMEPGAFILPAPLRSKDEGRDLTVWMDGAATPDGAVRIGLAHGSVRDFSRRQEARNRVDPARRDSAGLAYLALGDWHGTLEIGPGVWYAGTPEPDRHDSQETGQALLVEAAAGGGPIRVTPLPLGSFTWRSQTLDLVTEALAGPLLDAIEAAGHGRLVLKLVVTGALGLGALQRIEGRLDLLAARLAHLDLDRSGLVATPDPEELAALGTGPVLEAVAARLRDLAGGGGALPPGFDAGGHVPAQLASDALVRLWRLAQELDAGGRGGTAP